MINFQFSENEELAYNKFRDKHNKSCLRMGGKYSIIITPTGIGNGISVKCNVCGKVKDITDYGSW